MWIEKKVVPLQRKTQAGCSSARLEYASGGRVVAGSNPVTPTGKSLENQTIFEAFAFLPFPKFRAVDGLTCKSWGLRKKFSQSKEEKLDIRNSSKLSSERFYFSIENLCKGIG